MEINNFILILTFIPWIIYFLTLMIKNFTKKDYTKFSFKYLKKNIFQIFRLDILFLILIFYYFATFNLEFVIKYLFLIMVIYLLVNSYYEKKSKFKENFLKENILKIIFLFLITLIPFLIYLKTHNLVLTYMLMFLYLFFNYFITIIISFFTNKIKKLLNI